MCPGGVQPGDVLTIRAAHRDATFDVAVPHGAEAGDTIECHPPPKAVCWSDDHDAAMEARWLARRVCRGHGSLAALI